MTAVPQSFRPRSAWHGACVCLILAAALLVAATMQSTGWLPFACEAMLLVNLGLAVHAYRYRRWALFVLSGYVALVFGMRPLLVQHQFSMVHTAVGVSISDYRSGVAVVLGAATIGVLSAWCGYVLVERGGVTGRRQTTLPEHIRAPVRILILAAVGILCTGWLAHTAGGLGHAFDAAKVVRTDLSGALYPLFGVWTMQSAGLVILCARNSRRGERALAWALILGGAGAGLVAGSRGAATPIVLAALLIVLDRARPRARLRVMFAALVMLILFAVLGAYKQYSTPGQPRTSAVSMQNVAAQFNESDYFALVVPRRGTLPGSPQLVLAAVEAPLFMLPHAIYSDKPTPYDYEVREALVGGRIETGIPISLFGESWLIGGLPAVAVIFFGFGVAMAGGSRLVRASSLWAAPAGAVILGCVYLILSRPLVLGISRLFELQLAVAVAVMLLKPSRQSGRRVNVAAPG